MLEEFLSSWPFSSVLDYFFKDIVTCSSTFVDPLKIESGRQRNLQYRVSFHDLEEDKKTVELTSGAQ